MMKINILTLFPSMFDGFVNESIIKRAISDNKVKIEVNNIRDYANNKHNQVDDTPYGGGAGMVLMCEPVFKAVEDLKKKGTKVIMMTPQGKVFNQEKAVKLSKEKHLLIICGHYEGFDERITSIVDEEISIGDYILTGGEIPAMAVTDSVVRLIPGVIDDDSKANESFSDGLLDYPTYTKPREYRGMKVPNVLLSGDHKKIDEWRKEQQIEKTLEKRPEIIKNNKRKEFGDYAVIDDKSSKKMISINIDNPYKFNPSKKKEKTGINEVLLVEPTFTSKIVRKNLQKKLDELIKQVSLVLNDETDDEGTSYVLGEIDRIQSLILSTYANYLDNEYITLVIFKLEALKSEINMKQMEKLQTVNYEKKGRSR